jgi:hypothetical protein
MLMEQQVTLDPGQLSVEPGAEAVCRVRIQNRGTVVDEFTATVLGPAAQWATVEPVFVRLFPGEEGVIGISFRPPRSHLLAPGPVTFGVRVVATSVGEQSSVVEEGTIDIARFSEILAVLVPRRSRGRRSARHRLSVTNRGNVATVIPLSASDPDGALRFRFRPERIEAPPGATEYVGIKVRPVNRLLSGPSEFHNFQVQVQPAAAPPVQLQAAMEHRRLIPRWVPVTVLLLAVAVVTLLALRARNANPVSLASVGVATPPPGPAAAVGAQAPLTGGEKSVTGKTPPPATAPSAAPSPTSAPTPTPGPTGPCALTSATGRRSYYAADDTALDSGGAHGDGTLRNGAAYGPGATSGPSDKAFIFTGTSDVDLGTLPGAFGITDFCVSSAVRTTQQSAAWFLGNRYQANTPGQWWSIGMDATGAPSVELDNSAHNGRNITLTAARKINDGEWHNITLIRMGTLVNVYVDGSLAESAATGTVIDVGNTADTRIGYDGSHPFTGEIDDVALTQG